MVRASATFADMDVRLARGLLVSAVLASVGLGTPACSLGATWSTTRSPRVVRPQGTFSAVSCARASNCVAVGNQVDPNGTQQPLVQRSHGTHWSIESAPSPAGASVAALAGVSCPSPRFCMAIGSLDQFQAERPFAERWTGSSWRAVPVPALSGVSTGNLTSVACTSARFCMAVGSGGGGTLTERWDGSRWRALSAPNSPGHSFTYLSGVSCRTPSACTAVGIAGGRATDYPVAERWNGRAWQLQQIPAPHGSDDLNGVTCSSTRECIAVGVQQRYLHEVADSVMLVERWHAGRWTAQRPLTLHGARFTGATAVACSSASACTAVGYGSQLPDQAASAPVAARWNGSRWSVARTRVPHGNRYVLMSGVSCASTCTAVGTASYGSFTEGTGSTLAESLHGTRASLERTPDRRGVQSSSTASISCASVSFCIAVGYSGAHSAQGGFTLAERWSGSHWTVSPTPQPATPIPAAQLAGVSCPSQRFCAAVGSYIDYARNLERVLVEEWNGRAWSVATAPAPERSAPVLEADSCVGQSFCMAVGSYTSGPYTRALTELWNGRSWRLVRAPVPGVYTDLHGVSCVTRASCYAVGENGASQYSAPQVLAMHWDGARWSPQASTKPPTGSHPVCPPGPFPCTDQSTSSLTGVSCVPVTCLAVGAYTEGGPFSKPLAERLSGSRWALASPSGSSGELSGVACLGARNCLAVGSSPQSLTLAEAWNGIRWSVQSTPRPEPSHGAQLSSISCRAVNFCMAAGTNDGGGAYADSPVLLRYS